MYQANVSVLVQDYGKLASAESQDRAQYSNHLPALKKSMKCGIWTSEMSTVQKDHEMKRSV